MARLAAVLPILKVVAFNAECDREASLPWGAGGEAVMLGEALGPGTPWAMAEPIERQLTTTAASNADHIGVSTSMRHFLRPNAVTDSEGLKRSAPLNKGDFEDHLVPDLAVTDKSILPKAVSMI